MYFNISTNIHIYTAAHSATQSQLVEIKQLNQALLFEKEKLKQKLAETQVSLDKVCPLILYCYRYLVVHWDSDQLLVLAWFSPHSCIYCIKVPAATGDAPIQPDNLSVAEGVCVRAYVCVCACAHVCVCLNYG